MRGAALSVASRPQGSDTLVTVSITLDAEPDASGPPWVGAFAEHLFAATRARLALVTSVEPGLEHPPGNALSALVWPWRGAVILDREYFAIASSIQSWTGQATFWQVTQVPGGHALRWPGWFGAQGTTPRGAHWPWDVDLRAKENHRPDQLSVIGFGTLPGQEVLADALHAWVQEDNSLALDPTPEGLTRGAWLLLSLHGVHSQDLTHPFLDTLRSERLSILASLAAAGVVHLVRGGTRIVVAAPEHEAWSLEVHFSREDAPHGAAWQRDLLRALRRHLPLEWWAGDADGAVQDLDADALHDPEWLATHPYVCLPGGEEQIAPGWFQA